jgi:hypothetical protein
MTYSHPLLKELLASRKAAITAVPADLTGVSFLTLADLARVQDPQGVPGGTVSVFFFTQSQPDSNGTSTVTGEMSGYFGSDLVPFQGSVFPATDFWRGLILEANDPTRPTIFDGFISADLKFLSGTIFSYLNQGGQTFGPEVFIVFGTQL